ncbi:hypothetical protein B0H16DRAFT_1476913 [Mycena metata]|uniref:Uncharacterized protein n=1 Tax=Mycena metata TaxID=1033252 RepID=A0AAD7HAD0_9AGAR|nr:hypothetical protein B0H16DRAFT_1476913 [Mycena metata]
MIAIVPFVAQLPTAALPVCVCAATAHSPAPASGKATKADKAEKADSGPKAEKADAVVPAATCTHSTAGLPAPLIALLRAADGPFRANEVFGVVPTQALEPVEEEVTAPEWYTITRGRFVGVVDQYALAEMAISGVGGSARKSYTTQALAFNAFNAALTWGGVQVI